MKKDMANMGYKPVQFLTYHNQFIYQLDATNTGVTYDPEKKEFTERIIIDDDELLTSEENRAIYEEYGYMAQDKKVQEKHTTIWTFKAIKDYLLVLFTAPGKRYLTLCKKDDYQSFIYSPKSPNLKNDIIPTIDMNFLTTVVASDSDDSFLFMIDADKVEWDEGIRISSGNTEHLKEVREDDNPILLETFL